MTDEKPEAKSHDDSHEEHRDEKHDAPEKAVEPAKPATLAEALTAAAIPAKFAEPSAPSVKVPVQTVGYAVPSPRPGQTGGRVVFDPAIAPSKAPSHNFVAAIIGIALGVAAIAAYLHFVRHAI